MSAERQLLERIWREVAAIPRGCVATYGGIARRAGLGRRARLVGYALKVAPAALRLPWHRVVNARGAISFPDGSAQHALQHRRLLREGVRFRAGRIDLGIYGSAEADLDALLWRPRPP
ncbi:MAG: cysteine methyltransferase [Gammaproteobacteria bacterium]|nr:cysteine methyltransferase [Gammaproteobacteria bacterium]